MHVGLVVNTPAQAHLWKPLVMLLTANGHQLHVAARDYRETLSLLTEAGIRYTAFGRRNRLPVGNLTDYARNMPQLLRHFSRTKLEILLGTGLDVASLGALLQVPSIIFTDGEFQPMQLTLLRLLSTLIVTPEGFAIDFGRKHVRLPTYKEFSYLRPGRFEPDTSILSDLGLERDDRFSVLRFNAFDSLHDIGRTGFGLSEKRQLVRGLEKLMRVFISSEGPLPADLEAYRLRVECLKFADLVVTDTGTMATEAALLGTPTVVCASFVDQLSNFRTLEDKYHLLFRFRNADAAIQKSLELASTPGLKVEWSVRLQRLQRETVDLTEFMTWIVKHYPASLTEAHSEAARLRSKVTMSRLGAKYDASLTS